MKFTAIVPLLALSASTAAYVVSSDAVANSIDVRSAGSGAVLARHVLLEARHHKGKKQQKREDEVDDEFNDETLDKRHHKGKKNGAREADPEPHHKVSH